MHKYFMELWSFFEKICFLETDSSRERRQKVTLVIIVIFCCLNGILVSARNLVTARPSIEVLMPFTFSIVVGIALLIYFFTKRFPILLYPFLIMILIIPFCFQLSIGGFSGQGSVPILIWALLAPFGSLMFQNIRKASYWFLGYLVLVLIFLYTDEYFMQFAQVPLSFNDLPISHSDLMISQGLSILVFSIIIFVTMRYFVNAFQKEHARAEKLVVDLTQANKELESTLKELKTTQSELVQSEKMASLGKLAAGIAHEINNPIGALKSTASTSSQCLSKMEQFFETSKELVDIRKNAKIQNFFQILQDNNRIFTIVSDRVANTVNSFINFARLDKAGVDKVNIHECIDNTLSLIQHELKAKSTVEKIYGDIPKITCYPADLNQVFMNMLTNAAKAIENEGIITIRTFVEKGHVHVQISDSGIGISREQIKGLFDPNFTKDGSRVKASLGLFTSYNIIQKHHGEIKVESEVGKGSMFTIILPLELNMAIRNS